MSDFQTVKNKLREKIIIILDGALPPEKIFYATERDTMPEKPYIMITELSNQEDLGSGRNEPNNQKLEITEYKESVFTIAVYGLSENDFTEENNYFRTMLNLVRNGFEYLKFTHSLKKYFTIKSMTDLRPLNDTTDTGFMYRYEFDITCGYNDIIATEVKQSESVIIDLEDNNIHIEVNKENLNV